MHERSMALALALGGSCGTANVRRSASERVLRDLGRAALREVALDAHVESARPHARALPGRAWSAIQRGDWPVLDTFEWHDRTLVIAWIPVGTAPRGLRLTDREQSVLSASAAGASHKEIAGRLGVARATVASLLGRARVKLGARSAADLLAFARTEDERGA